MEIYLAMNVHYLKVSYLEMLITPPLNGNYELKSNISCDNRLLTSYSSWLKHDRNIRTVNTNSIFIQVKGANSS